MCSFSGYFGLLLIFTFFDPIHYADYHSESMIKDNKIHASVPGQTNVVDFNVTSVIGGVERCHFHMFICVFWNR
jgi:hypothetical protein